MSEIENKILAGVDDATKCPCIGSIFLVGVIAAEKTIENWQKIGVKDSKLIAFRKREKLAKIIKKTAIGYVIEQITPQMIDNKDFNLNEWEMLVLLKIMKKLQKYGTAEKVYVDNWETTLKGFNRRLKSIKKYSLRKKLVKYKFRINRKNISAINFIPEHYADEKYTVVGAASILAKSASDFQYRKYRKIFGNFGSGNPGDPKTRLFVWQTRHNPPHIVRQSWETFKNLVNLEKIEDDPLFSNPPKKVVEKKLIK